MFGKAGRNSEFLHKFGKPKYVCGKIIHAYTIRWV